MTAVLVSSTIRNVTLAVLAVLFAPFVTGFLLRRALDSYTPKPGASYLIRCGGPYIVWMLACAASASLASFIYAGTLIYTDLKRARGHALNGWTISQAAASVACGLAFSLPFWNLRNAPCIVAPAFYGAVVLAVGVRALHTLLRTSVLVKIPSIDIDTLVVEGAAQIEQLKSNGEITHPQRVITAEFLERCLNALHELNVEEGNREDAK